MEVCYMVTFFNDSPHDTVIHLCAFCAVLTL